MAKQSTSCPTLTLIHVLGKKWTIPIIELLYPLRSPLSFTSIQELLVDITPKNLSKSLKELSQAGVIKRVEGKSNGIKYTQYSLTESGKSVEQLVKAAKGLGTCIYGVNTYCVSRQCHLCSLLKATA